jgi:hypothetical protein
MDEFTFVVSGVRNGWTRDEVVEVLKRFIASHPGRRLSSTVFNAWAERPCAWQTAVKPFGSWREALRAAGCGDGRVRKYSAAELIDELERVWRKLGRNPQIKEFERHSGISAQTFGNRWGSLRAACEAFAKHKRGELTREELLNVGWSPVRERRRAMRPRVRYEVLSRDGFRCTACGASPKDDPSVKLHVDHVVPVCEGGGNEKENLRTLCARCNQGKGGG